MHITLIADTGDAVSSLLTTFETSQHETVTDIVADTVSNGEALLTVVDTDAVSVSSDHLDPSRLPPAQRQLYMRIQQKQHRDDKPISDITAKRTFLIYFCRIFWFPYFVVLKFHL